MSYTFGFSTLSSSLFSSFSVVLTLHVFLKVTSAIMGSIKNCVEIMVSFLSLELELRPMTIV